jgi:GNAT superfamily N-acetyltransferase
MLTSRARTILAAEGPTALLRRGARFVARLLVVVERVYLYRIDLTELPPSPDSPWLDTFTTNFLCSNEDADRLVAQGYEDVRGWVLWSSRPLRRGAVAFCVYSGTRLAHVGWLGLSKEAKECFDDVPYAIDFARGEGWTGGVFTSSAFRGMGLMRHSYSRRLAYLRAHGCVMSRAMVRVGNVPSQRAISRTVASTRVRVLHLRLFGWHWLRQGPSEEAVPLASARG